MGDLLYLIFLLFLHFQSSRIPRLFSPFLLYSGHIRQFSFVQFPNLWFPGLGLDKSVPK